MSALRTIELPDIKNVKMLAAALLLMNEALGKCVQENATRVGFSTHRDHKDCDLVLARKHFNGAEDIGWKRVGDKLSVFYDVDDTYRLAEAFNVDDFFSSVSQYYTAAVSKQELEYAGYACEIEKQKNGTLQVVATSWV